MTPYNLDYELIHSNLISQKCQDDYYAQNLYAALCNTSWQKLDTMHIISGISWDCSWRFAAAVVANIRKKGDYTDWYCTGTGKFYPTVQDVCPACRHVVAEGEVTNEIKEDLKTLGWYQID